MVLGIDYVKLRPHAKKRMRQHGVPRGVVFGMLKNPLKECCVLYEDTKKHGKNLHCEDRNVALVFYHDYNQRHRNVEAVVKTVMKPKGAEERYDTSRGRFKEVEA